MSTVPTSAPRRLFVYGSLRTGEYNNYILEGSKLVNASTYIPGFELISLGAFPAIVPAENGRVIGEVWDVDERAFNSIERMEVGAGYKRVAVQPIDESDLVPIGYTDVEAYVYGTPARLIDCPRVPSGDWTKRGEIEVTI